MRDIAAAAAEAQAVRKATAGDVPALATALGRAFYDDPHARWVFRSDKRRMKRLRDGYVVGLRGLFLPQDECYTTPGVVGGAIWMKPGQSRIGALQQLRLAPAMAAAYRRDIVPLGRLLATMDAMHPHEPDHWYLAFLGVDPDWQGRGIGAALMAPVIEHCDRDGTPAYLEASSEGNRGLYERHGFAVRREYRLWGGGPTGWTMWRE